MKETQFVVPFLLGKGKFMIYFQQEKPLRDVFSARLLIDWLHWAEERNKWGVTLLAWF